MIFPLIIGAEMLLLIAPGMKEELEFIRTFYYLNRAGELNDIQSQEPDGRLQGCSNLSGPLLPCRRSTCELQGGFRD